MHAYDQIVMNTLGWTSVAIPEQGTSALMLIGFGGLGAAMRLRRKAIAAA